MNAKSIYQVLVGGMINRIKNSTIKALRAILLVNLVVMSSAILADDDHDLARKLKEAGDILPLEQLLKKARAYHPGQLIKIELEKKYSYFIYEVEILDKQGQVWEMKFDAKTGELIKMEKED